MTPEETKVIFNSVFFALWASTALFITMNIALHMFAKTMLSFGNFLFLCGGLVLSLALMCVSLANILSIVLRGTLSL